MLPRGDGAQSILETPFDTIGWRTSPVLSRRVRDSKLHNRYTAIYSKTQRRPIARTPPHATEAKHSRTLRSQGFPLADAKLAFCDVVGVT